MNRDKTAREMYPSSKVECYECGINVELHQVDDGHGTVLCETCIEKTIEELSFSDDFSKEPKGE